MDVDALYHQLRDGKVLHFCSQLTEKEFAVGMIYEYGLWWTAIYTIQRSQKRPLRRRHGWLMERARIMELLECNKYLYTHEEYMRNTYGRG
jgi:hypothetical protein